MKRFASLTPAPTVEDPIRRGCRGGSCKRSRSLVSRLVGVVLLLACLGTATMAYADYVVPMVERRLTTNAAEQWYPAISGTKVVYQDDRNGNRDIYCYDLATSTEKRLTTSGANQDSPAISGTKVSYQDDRNGNWDIYCYDLATGTERRLTTSGAEQVDSAISGNKVVYADYRNGNYDIYCYDLATSTDRRLTTSGANQLSPAISGTKVVYQDERNGNWDIYCYDLTTGVEKRLTTDSERQDFPAISGTKVVYQDNRNGGIGDIYLWDLAANTEKRLTTDAAEQASPAISGNRVVFTDSRDGNSNVYLGELAVPALTASAPSVVGYGAAATVTGTLSSLSGIPVAGRTVVLETSTDGITWTPRGTALTSSGGAYSAKSPGLTSAVYIRTDFKGDAGYLSSQSSSLLVKPTASLGTPVAPATMYRTRYYSVYGTLRPRHTVGTYPVRIYKYRYISGAWRSYGYINAKASNYSTYTRYAASVKLPYAGRWRLRAYAPTDSLHAAVWSSGYDYVTVK